MTLSVETRELLVREARRFLGPPRTPFHEQGRLVGAGVDCAGVVVVPLLALSFPVRDAAGYGPDSGGALIAAGMDGAVDAIDLEDADSGDVLTFWRTRRGCRFRLHEHVAWLTERWSMLHAWDATVGVTEHVMDERWRERLTGAWRLREAAAWRR